MNVSENKPSFALNLNEIVLDKKRSHQSDGSHEVNEENANPHKFGPYSKEKKRKLFQENKN